jgi:hypothetical protein
MPVPFPGAAKRPFRGAIFLFFLTLLFSACDSYNLSFRDFYEGNKGGLTTGESGPPLLTSIAEIEAYLAASTANPVPLRAGITLDDTGWRALLDAIYNAGKLVALDLSACARGAPMAGGGLFNDGTFEPNPSIIAGKDKIVSLALPGTATSVVSGSPLSPSFLYFTALESVTGKSVTLIGDYAFGGCTALSSVYLPNVANIGAGAFSATGGTGLTVTLGSPAPALGTGIFGGVAAGKNVTVKVPSGATGYGTVPRTYAGMDALITWGNGFRGGGWDGTYFLNSLSINSNISLSIVALP